MKNINTKYKAALALLLVVGVVGVGAIVKGFSSEKGALNVFENGSNVTLNQEVPKEAEPTFGALSGPEIPSPYLIVGGVTQWYGSMDMRSATTTVCALQSPSVTSTLEFAAGSFDITSTTASVITIAKSANAFVTTTVLNSDLSVSANAKALVFASSTQAINDQRIFAPSQWVVVSMKGGVGDFSPTGKCRAIFTSHY